MKILTKPNHKDEAFSLDIHIVSDCPRPVQDDLLAQLKGNRFPFLVLEAPAHSSTSNSPTVTTKLKLEATLLQVFHLVSCEVRNLNGTVESVCPKVVQYEFQIFA